MRMGKRAIKEPRKDKFQEVQAKNIFDDEKIMAEVKDIKKLFVISLVKIKMDKQPKEDIIKPKKRIVYCISNCVNKLKDER